MFAARYKAHLLETTKVVLAMYNFTYETWKAKHLVHWDHFYMCAIRTYVIAELNLCALSEWKNFVN